MLKQLLIENNLVKNRENTRLEFKSVFHLQIKSYIRSIAAFANSSGGQIIFGVEDRPRRPIGLGGSFKKFDEFDNKALSTCIQNCLSTNIDFEMDYFKQKINENEIIFGVLTIKEASQKPVVCKVSDGRESLREAAIYYRYNAKNEEIKAQDLINLIQNEKDKEKQLWLQHLQKITQIGVQNVGVFSYDGEIFAGDHKIIIDKDAVKQIKFIKEGNFVEKEGSPALILKGKIENTESLEVITISSDPNKTHPFEGMSSVENEIRNSKKITFVSKQNQKKEANNFCIKINDNKMHALSFVLTRIVSYFCISSKNNPDLMWENEKRSVKKYSQEFIDKMIVYITNEETLNEIFN